jgi:hypothetical protein
MKKFANQYEEGSVIKTDVEIEYSPERNLYLIYPIFYVKNKTNFPHHIYKHMLSQRVEDLFGVSVHSGAARVKEIE